MSYLRVCFIILLSVFFGSLAHAATTAVFSDSQFTASNYGYQLAKQCLHPENFPNTDRVSIRPMPGGSPVHLATNNAVGSGARVWNNNITTKNNVSRFTPYKCHPDNPRPCTYVNGHFTAAVNDTKVDRVMIFMGINTINLEKGIYSLAHWKDLAQRITEKGKECIVGLPPLVDHDAYNSLIVSHNKALVEHLQGSGCRFIDTSNTLTQGKEGLQIKTVEKDNVHFANSVSASAAKATCDALERIKNEATVPEPAYAEVRESDNAVIPAAVEVQSSSIEWREATAPDENELPSFIGEGSTTSI